MKVENKVVCGENCPNYYKLGKEVIKQTTSEEIEQLCSMFKIFSDNTRLKIICTILNNELRVSDICDILKINRTTISHQLKILRDTKLVKHRKEGTQVYYSLKDSHIEQIIVQALAHVKE